MLTTNCPVCKTAYTSDEAICRHCGTYAVRNARVCPACSYVNPGDSNYCLKCAKGFHPHSVMKAHKPVNIDYHFSSDDKVAFDLFVLKCRKPFSVLPASLLRLLLHLENRIDVIRGKQPYRTDGTITFGWESIADENTVCETLVMYQDIFRMCDVGEYLYLFHGSRKAIVIPSREFHSGKERMNAVQYLSERIPKERIEYYDYALNRRIR